MIILLSLLLLCSITKGQDAPRLISQDGNLIIKPGLNRNVTIDISGQNSYINIGHENLMHLIVLVKNSTRNMKNLEEYTVIIEDSVMSKVNVMLSKRNGVLSRLTALERTGGSSNSTSNSRLDLQYRRMRRNLNTLTKKVRNLNALLNKNECASNPCKNGASCMDIFNGFICQCGDGWEGKDCSTDVDECVRFKSMSIGCQNEATCQNLPGSFMCHCKPGFYGIHCSQKTLDCTTGSRELCGHGTCIQQGTKIECICEPGWKKESGSQACTLDINECEGNQPPCSIAPIVPCINVPGSFYCGSCPVGYSGNGYYCSDIDECQINNGGCSMTPRVQCINTIGSKLCGQCPPGFDGDGVTCNVKEVCQVNNGGCNMHALCTYNPLMGVRCTCLPGFTGDGAGPRGCTYLVPGAIDNRPTELPRLHCKSNPCLNGTCHENFAGYHCICNRGYSGRNCDRPLQLCDPNPCQNGGTCFADYKVLAYRCECPPGYTGFSCKTPKACTTLITNPEGTISFPTNNHTWYGHNVSCVWKIMTRENKVLNVTFTKFHLEASKLCNFDWLQIHDGPNTLSHPIGKFCGTDLPRGGNFITTHNTMFLWFRSDHDTAKEGFSLHWISIDPQCGGTENKSHGSISSPGSPGLYPKNRDCYWKIIAPMGKRIQLLFFRLEIENHPSCEFDHLTIYDGRTDSSSVLDKFCNTSYPAPVISSGSEALIYFHSDNVASDNGFQIAYSVIEGIPGCGGIYTSVSGELSSPTTNGSYSTNMMCEYKIRLVPDTRVKILFLKFELEESDDCNFDFLALYDGSSTESPLIGKYCGTNVPNVFESTTNELLIVFKSDWSNTHPGFKIHYDTVCFKTFTENSGVIKSQGYPKSYPVKLLCKYLIALPTKKAIKMHFIDFDIEGHSYPECIYDYLKVYDGFNSNSSLIGTYCGKDSLTPPDILSNLNHLLLEFKSDDSLTGSGFYINYTSIDLECGGVLKDRSGIIEYPDDKNHDNNQYKNDMFCRWVLVAPSGFHIRVTWLKFDIEEFNDCSADYLEIYENNTLSSHKIGRYCGKTVPPAVTSVSNIVSIMFKSDESFVYEGFSFSYVFIDATKSCGGSYSIPFGSITSPGWPKTYPQNKDCTWTIRTDTGKQILLNFTTFEIESYTKCMADFVEISNGDFINAPVIGKYCGDNKPPIITSMGNFLKIHFQSDSSREYGGFHITWESFDGECGGALEGQSGSLISPNYPQPYDGDTECYWKISTSAGSLIEIIFVDLDFEDQPTCFFDYIEVFNSVDTEKDLIGRFCEQSSTRKHVTSKSNHVYIKFRSDSHQAGKGFHLTYNTICDNEISGFSGVIESSNFPNEYGDNLDCKWKITVPKGNKINVTFSHFNLEEGPGPDYSELIDVNKNDNKDGCSYDYVELSDGTDAGEKTYYCGISMPPMYTSKNNVTVIKFHTDELRTNTGFRLEWSIFGCGGKTKRPSGEFKSPGYPKEYLYDTQCDWVIEVLPGSSVEFNIVDFDSLGGKCDNPLTIYNGPDADHPILLNTCTKNHTVTSTGNFLYARFVTNDVGRKLFAKYKTVKSQCGGVFSGIYGMINSPGYPKNYPEKSNCLWYISVPKNHRVNLTFTDFDIGSTDCNDYVKIYDGWSPQNESLITKYCGNASILNKTILSIGNNMVVEFVSTSPYTSKGFRANYAMTCGMRVVTESEGTITPHADIKSVDNLSECTWTIIGSKPSDRVSLTFTHLDISDKPKNHLQCGSQYVAVFNGESKDAPPIGKYCGNRIPSTIVSKGNAITILMSAINFYRGLFTASYSVMETACGGELTAEHGTFTSPFYPNSYPMNSDCVWKLNTSPGNSVQLVFKMFDIENSDGCDEDYVEIRKESGIGEILGLYCGNTIPENSTVGNKLWVKFHSSGVGTGTGFIADYSFVHGNELEGETGRITSPLYPKPYVQPGKFTWRIKTELGQTLRITFKEFKIESLSDSCDHYLAVYDGYDDKSILLTKSCGIEIPASVESSTNMIYIEMNTDMMQSGSLFNLEWKTVTNKAYDLIEVKLNNSCGMSEIIRLSNDTKMTINSPGYPDGYSELLNCTWIFETDPHRHLNLVFKKMSLEEEISCYLDKVNVYSGSNDGNNWNKVGSYCLANATENLINSTTNLMKIEFITDTSANRSGFLAEVSQVCGSEMTDPSGIIEASFPIPMPRPFHITSLANKICEWKVKVKPGKRIKLEFLDMFLNSTKDICDIYLSLRNGMSLTSPILGQGKYCDNTIPEEPLITSENYLYVKYYMPMFSLGLTKSRFKLRYSEMGRECGERTSLSILNNKTIIKSPNYPNIPHPFTECVWVILAPPGERIKINFIDRFDLAKTDNCESEFVQIRDGGTENAEELGKFCTRTTPATVRTSGNAIYVKYSTQLADPKNGFKAEIAIDVCGGTIFAENGILNSPKHSESFSFLAEVECVWKIIAKKNHNFEISINNLTGPDDKCEKSSLEIYDTVPYNSSGEVLVAKICEANLQNPQLITASNEIIIKYKTNKSILKNPDYGFSLSYNISADVCVGDFSTPEGTLLGPKYTLFNTNFRHCAWMIKVTKGRRITLEILQGVNKVQSTRDINKVRVYGSLQYDSPLDLKSVGDSLIAESTSNTMLVYFTTKITPGIAQFKARYTSDKPSICPPDLQESGVLEAPEFELPYYCEYNPIPREYSNRTFVMSFSNMTFYNQSSRICTYRTVSVVKVIHGAYPRQQMICTNTESIRFAAVSADTRIVIMKKNSPISFRLDYKTVDCGGYYRQIDDKTKLSLPENIDGPVDCFWTLYLRDNYTINFSGLKFTADCNSEYLQVQSGFLQSYKFCLNTSPIAEISKSFMLPEIKYHSDRLYNTTKLDVKFNIFSGCGEVYKLQSYFSSKVIVSPNFPRPYESNTECYWEMRSDPGYRIKLMFEDRFFIQQSENCSKDFIEVFDFAENVKKSMGRFCGRKLPGELKSTSSKLFIMFRSDSSINGDGFKLRLARFCGGELTATNTPQLLISPKNPDGKYGGDMTCDYTIKVPERQYVTLNFLKFELESPSINGDCKFDNVTLTNYVPPNVYVYNTPTVYCGNNSPGVKRYEYGVIISLKTDKYVQRKGFEVYYSIDDCGAIINKSQEITSPKFKKLPYHCNCIWNITAPEGKAIFVKFRKFKIAFAQLVGIVSIYEGHEESPQKLLLSLGGDLENTAPSTKSKSNKMLFVMKGDVYDSTDKFTADIIFIKGESSGCGGTIHLNQSQANFNISGGTSYESFLLCDWLVKAPKDYMIKIVFDSFHVAPCFGVNQTAERRNKCSCDYLEIRDGAGHHSPLIGTYCGHDKPAELITSSNSMWIRFVSDGLVSSTGIKATLFTTMSVCGKTELISNSTMASFAPPRDSNGNVLKGIRCTWAISGGSPFTDVLHLRILNIDLERPNHREECDKDRLEISNNGIEVKTAESGITITSGHNFDFLGVGNPTNHFTFAFCGKIPLVDFYNSKNPLYITLITSPEIDKEHTGFKIEYALNECDRNHTEEYGKIYMNYIAHNVSQCIRMIKVPKNYTISLYLDTLMNWNNETFIWIKDGESASSPILQEVKGGFNIQPMAIFSTTNVMRIEIKKAVIGLHRLQATYTSSDKGRGCGGRIMNNAGIIYSPGYPTPYRGLTPCEWDVEVPHETFVSLKFDLFDLGSSTTCEADYLELQDREGTVLRKYCPGDNPADFNGRSNYVKIVQHASINNGGPGWKLKFKTRMYDEAMATDEDSKKQ